MYLEFFIAGLTGFFAWLLLRHVFAFQRERVCQRAGKLLREVELPRKSLILRRAGGVLAFFALSGMFILQDYMMFFFKMKMGDTLEFGILSRESGYNVILEFHLCIILFVLLLYHSFFSRRARLSFEIRENGLIFGFPAGILHVPWNEIEFCVFDSAKKRLQLQRKGHLSILRRRLTVVEGEAVTKFMGQFAEIRDRAGNVLTAPSQSVETPQLARAAKKPRQRFFRFQFDLLSLMLLMLLVATAASWYGYRQHRTQPIKNAVAALAEFQPMVVYRDVDVQYLLFWGSGKKPGDKDLIALRSFPNLEALGFSGAPGVTDAGLAEVEPLSHLKMLDLMATSITDAGLSRLTCLTELRELNLMATGITDAGLAKLKPLNRLQFLHLAGTKITDDGLVHLQSFPLLEMIDLPGTAITDKGLQHLASLKKLRTLSLVYSNISDAELVRLKPLAQLEELKLDGTHISDAGLPTLGEMKNLKSLEIRTTQISPEGYKMLQNSLPNTKILYTPPVPETQASTPGDPSEDSEAKAEEK
jgi:hypothetical protein